MESKTNLAEEQLAFANMAKEIVDEAATKGIKLRILGAIAVILHCQGSVHLLQALDRQLTDIDFVGLSADERKIEDMFLKQGFSLKSSGVTMEVWDERKIFTHASKPGVDVFFDRLNFCHEVNFKKRMNVDSPTISLADLLLEKLQIVHINEKDIKDLIVLNLEHNLGDSDALEVINAKYVAGRLSYDWGFYYTATTNLKKVSHYCSVYEPLTANERVKISNQVDALLSLIEKEPKSMKWKMRSKVGTKAIWYNNPGEEYREV